MKTLSAVFLFAFFWCAAAGEIDFTHADIAVPSGNKAGIKPAAGLLKSYMDKLSDGKTGIVPASKRKTGIFLHLAAPSEKLGKQAWRLRQSGKSVHITGGSPSALIYGVSDFLARSGIYAVAWNCDALPPSKRLMVREGLDITARRAFPRIRIVNGLGSILSLKDSKPIRDRWNRYLQMNYAQLRYDDDDTPYRSYRNRNEVHNLYQYLPPGKYAKDHPEYYSMNAAGRRVWSSTDHLCFSNPEVRRVMAENIIGQIRQHRAEMKTHYPVLYRISQNDCGGQFCFCPNCVATAKKYGGETGLLLEFVNAVAEQVTAKYPDVKISTEAYVNSEKPLPTIKPNKHVLMRYMDLYSRSNFQSPLEAQPDRAKILYEWAAIQPYGLAIWDYLNTGTQFPEITLDAYIQDLRLFRKIRAGYLLTEYQIRMPRPQSFIFLQYFVTYQLMKDPSQDAEKLIDIFFTNYYGKAAGEMRAYFDFLRNAVRNNGRDISDQRKHIDLSFLEKSRSILHAALGKAGNDKVLKCRILQELNNVDYAYIRLLKFRNGNSERTKKIFEQYKANLLFFVGNTDLLSKSARNNLRNAVNADLDLLSVDFPLPDALKGKDIAVSHKVALSFLRHSGGMGGGRLIDDPVSDMKKAVAIIGEKKVKHSLPFAAGFYDWGTKKSGVFLLKKVIADNRYHWYKLGTVKVGARTVLWVHGSWGMMADLSSFYINDDGLTGDHNPNFYEAWVSLRFTGPAYSGDKNAENSVWFDKLLLVSSN